jgi:hypothetical protein
MEWNEWNGMDSQMEWNGNGMEWKDGTGILL